VGTSRSWDAKDLAAGRHTFLPGELDDRPDRSIATPLRQYPHWVSISFETSSSPPLDIVAPVSLCPARDRADAEHDPASGSKRIRVDGQVAMPWPRTLADTK
jgi:hypothetical protein